MKGYFQRLIRQTGLRIGHKPPMQGERNIGKQPISSSEKTNPIHTETFRWINPPETELTPRDIQENKMNQENLNPVRDGKYEGFVNIREKATQKRNSNQEASEKQLTPQPEREAKENYLEPSFSQIVNLEVETKKQDQRNGDEIPLLHESKNTKDEQDPAIHKVHTETKEEITHSDSPLLEPKGITIHEIRKWVARTPTPDELSDGNIQIFNDIQVDTQENKQDSSASYGATKNIHSSIYKEPEVQENKLTIGSIHISVEAPPEKSIQPPLPNISIQADPNKTTESDRLTRHYIRLPY